MLSYKCVCNTLLCHEWNILFRNWLLLLEIQSVVHISHLIAQGICSFYKLKG